MSDTLTRRLTQLWHSMAHRNDWQLVVDVQGFIQGITSSFDPTIEPEDAALEIAILRAYNGQLYRALKQREERAAYELWFTCIRMIRAADFADLEVEAVAQEVVSRLLARLYTIKNPETTMFYMRKILRTVVSGQRQRKTSVSLEAEVANGALAEPSTLVSTAERVEQQVTEAEILALLQRKLPHRIERIVVIRAVLLGEKTGEIAQDLAISSHTVAVAKYRALQRLRADAEVLQFCAALANQPVTRVDLSRDVNASDVPTTAQAGGDV